jgi:hypothetical protein
LGDHFAQAGAKNLVPRSTGSVLFATLLFTNHSNPHAVGT